MITSCKAVVIKKPYPYGNHQHISVSGNVSHDFRITRDIDFDGKLPQKCCCLSYKVIRIDGKIIRCLKKVDQIKYGPLFCGDHQLIGFAILTLVGFVMQSKIPKTVVVPLNRVCI